KKVTTEPSAVWRDGIVVNEGLICMALKVIRQSHGNTQCFLHACQTLGAMSGSSIFIKKNDDLHFVGIHIGTTKFEKDKYHDDSHVCNDVENSRAFNNRQANIALNFIN